MHPLPLLLVTALGLGFAPSAWSDCVDFNQKRAEAAAAALMRNAPTAAQLGMPGLDGLTLDAIRTTGDPKCDGGPPYKRIYYTTQLTFAELVARWYPVIRRRTEVDGMKREWFRNPFHGNQIFFTSGTRVEFVFGRGTEIVRFAVYPVPAPGGLPTENQPYTASEIIEGTPWPGGAKGPRQFVRADQGGSVQPVIPSAPAVSAEAAPAVTKPAPAANCPPRTAQGGGEGAAQRAGSDIGSAVLGGGFGRSLGSAVGGVLGSLTAAPASAPADPNCP
jgi:hypothetical protein